MLFVVPKTVGTAVVRNRARRRVRGALRDLARTQGPVLAGGEYRLGISAPLEALSGVELRAVMGELLRDVHR